MSTPGKKHGILPLAVSAGVVVLLLALALVPNTGAIPAATNCQYGGCDQTNSTSSTLWYGLLAALVIVAIALGLLLLMRRRRAKPGGPVEPWAGDGAAVAGAGAAGTLEGPTGPEGMDVNPEVPAGAASYIETPEDVGAVAAAGAVGGAAAETGEADIDSLMQELDKISGEILKKGPPTKKTPTESATDDEGTSD